MELGEQTVEKKDVKKRGNTPYWMKNVVSTPELVLRYQLGTKELQDVLQADLRVLRELNQVYIGQAQCRFIITSSGKFEGIIEMCFRYFSRVWWMNSWINCIWKWI